MIHLRIGILSINDPRRGLWRDAETLLWALQQPPPRRGGCRPAAVSLFPVANYAGLEQRPEAAPAARAPVPALPAVAPGLRFGEWLGNIDVLIVCEKLLPIAFALARRRGVRVIYIPNLDWAILGTSTARWVESLRGAGCEVWAKTAQIARALADAGITSHSVPWSIPDPVARDRVARINGPVTFLLNAGMGGWRNRRGVDIALQAFALAQRQLSSIRLIVKSIRPIARNAPARLIELPNLELIEAMLDREDLARLYNRADAVLYPSRWEGFGLSLLEALHAGVPVIASDGWPMNELIEHGHNGLLAAARRAGTMRLAPWWECDPAALAEQMLRFAGDPELRRRLTCPEPSELAAGQHHFVIRVRELVFQEPPPRVVIVRPRAEPVWRRSEEYWADALRMHGYTVDTICFDAAPDSIQQALARPHDFVLVGKLPASFLQSIGPMTEQPIVAWHHDDIARMRRWTHAVGPLVDLLCLPQSNLAHTLPELPTPALPLLPGAKLDGDRGPGRRPRVLARPDTGGQVVFLGNNQARGNRRELLRNVGRHYDLTVYGKGWAASGINTEHPIWSKQAAEVNRRAQVVLSISINKVTPHYTSNRLFNSCAAGASVVAEAFPGLEDHYPAQAVASFHNAEECVVVIGQLLADKDRRASMRAAAEDHSWRHHTWADRIAVLLDRIRTLALSRSVHGLPPDNHFWDERARKMGRRAVGYYRWNEARFEAETHTCWNRLRPHIAQMRAPEDHRLLDFGCGVGRFATLLAAEQLHVVGVDSSAEMLQMTAALARPGIEFHHLRSGRPLPFATGSFDILWTFTVLQHIPDQILPSIIDELRRVLRPGALLLLCENTELLKGRLSRSGHVVFRRPEEYIAMLPGLRGVDTLVIEGERHSILVGRLNLNSGQSSG